MYDAFNAPPSYVPLTEITHDFTFDNADNYFMRNKDNWNMHCFLYLFYYLLLKRGLGRKNFDEEFTSEDVGMSYIPKKNIKNH